MIEINSYEHKFLEILKNEISLEEFETWLYGNQQTLIAQLPVEIYDELILLNYKTKESKHELARTLKIDYEKLELYEIQQLLEKELENKPVLNSVKHEIDLYELGFISFDFQIGNLKFRMHNPFKMENFPTLNNAERGSLFLANFGSGEQFLVSLLDSIGTNKLRVYNIKKHEQTDGMTNTKIMETKNEEFKVLISGHFCYINKQYIRKRMKKAWQ